MKAHLSLPYSNSITSPTSTWRLGTTFLLLFLVSLTFNASAQTKVWEKTFGGLNNDTYRTSVAGPNGGYLFGGSSLSGIGKDKNEASRGDYDYWIVKTDVNGNKQWDKRFGGSRNDVLTALIATPDGGYLLGGKSTSPLSGDKSQSHHGNFNVEDYWVVKIDANGTKQWDKTFGGDGYDELSALAYTPDGGYLLVGSSSIGTKGAYDFWVIKVNSSGTKVWDKYYGGSGFESGKVAIVAAADGGYLLGGSSSSGISGDKSEAGRGGNDYWLVKIDETGSKLWDKTLGGNAADTFYALLATADGGYLLGGTSNSGISGDKTEFSKSFSSHWLVKTNASGNKIWDKTFYGGYTNKFYDLVPSPQGGYLVGGYADKGTVGIKTEYGAGYWVVNIDPQGKKIWDKLYGNYTSLQAVPNGYLLGGSYNSGSGDTDYTLLKLDASGKVDQSIVFTPVPIKMYGQPPFQVEAKANTGFPVVLSIASGPATIKDNIVTLTGPGTVVVKATQAGTELFNAAEATQTLTVEDSKYVFMEWDRALYGSQNEEVHNLNDMVATPDGGTLITGFYTPGSDRHPPQKNLVTKINSNGTIGWQNITFPFEPGAIVAGADSGYLIVSAHSGQGLKRKIMKIDDSGNKIWEKEISNPDYSFDYSRISSFVATPDGGYLLGAETISSADPGDYSLLKIDADCNKMWDKTFVSIGYDYSPQVVVTADGGYLLGGTTQSGIGGDKTEASRGESDYWMIKLDANGNKIWDKTLGGSSWDQLYSLVALPDGTVLLGGSSWSGISGDKTAANKDTSSRGTDYWVVKINAQGNKLWDKTFGGNAIDILRSMVMAPDGNILLGGTSRSSISGDKSEESIGSSDYWIVKIDREGNKLWDKRLGSEEGNSLSEIVITTNEDYILGGVSGSAIGGHKTETSVREGSEFWIVKLTVDVPLPPTPTAWDLRYGGSSADRFTVVIQTQDGGYLSGGHSASAISGDKSQPDRGGYDFWIVKTDKNGTRQWDKTYGGSKNDFLNRIILTQDGGYLLAGSSTSGKGGDKTTASRGDQDYWLVKISSTGVKEWDKTYGGSGFDDLRKVNQLFNGDYLLAGQSNSPLSGDKSQSSRGGLDFWVVRINSTGTKLWDQRYGGAADEYLESFTKTSDGGFLLAGSSASGQSGEKSQASKGGKDYWLVKINSNGTQQWDRSYGGSQDEELYSVGITPAGEYFVAGHSFSGQSGDKSQPSRGSSDYWMLKISKSGQKLWDKSFGGSGQETLRSIIEASGGGYVLAGTSNSGISGDKSQASRGGYDFWLVKTDGQGNKEYDQRLGGAGTEEFRFIERTPDGGYLLGGRSDSGVSGDRSQPSQGGMDYWLVKVAPVMATAPIARIATPTTASGLQLSAYPNPTAGQQVTVTFTVPQTQLVRLKVYDHQSREVATLFQAEAQAGQVYQATWLAQQQAAGMYLLRLQTPDKSTTHKLLLTK